jgi:predicted membrane metal-binding protein
VLFVHLHASRCVVPACVLFCCALYLCACVVLVCLHASVCIVVLCLCACDVLVVLCLCVCCACLHACVRVHVCVLCCACRTPAKAGQAPAQAARCATARPGRPRLSPGWLRPWPGRHTSHCPGRRPPLCPGRWPHQSYVKMGRGSPPHQRHLPHFAHRPRQPPRH